MTDDSLDSARSLDTVIRGFTDAELALREVAGAVERIRSASDQLDASRADQAAAREALAGTTAAVRLVGENVEAVARAVHENTAILSSLDPERLWSQLNSHSTELKAASARSTEVTVQATERVLAQLDRQARSGRRLTLLVSAALVAALASLALVVALTTGVLPLA